MIDASNVPLGKLPWGCQDKEYKKRMSLLKRAVVVDGGGGDKIYFTYENVPSSRIPSQDDISKLWTSVPYDRNKNMLIALTEQELQDVPGLKQHVPHDDTELETTQKDQDYKDHVEVGNSYHRMSINRNITTITGPGPKFFNDGCNLCNNAVITRFDKNGNIQMMAMKRPENADSDAGEYQMSAGCLFFGGNGHKIKVDGSDYLVQGSVKYNIAEGPENVDDDGKLKGEAKAHAIASILEKLWTDEKSKEIIEKFDFHLLSKGIVDDTSNTRHRWVETSYVIHHITGSEDPEVLEHLKDSKVNPKRDNVGDGVWRSIELNPKGKVYSQVGIEENNEYKKVWVEHDESSRAYDPATEFEFWHGDHSFVAARICEYVSSNYRFVKQGECGFGVSKPLDDPVKPKVWEIENLLLEGLPKAKLSELTVFSSTDKFNQLDSKWLAIKEKITSIGFCQSVLEYETGVRTITVMKDIELKNETHFNVHRKYTAKDSLLQKILRRNPPEDIKECLAKSSPIYKASQKLFKIVEKTSLLDDSWITFTQEFNKLKKEESNQGYGFNCDEIKRVFLIRHTHREDTILNLSARKNPPLAVIELIFSEAGRESTCVVDCKRWDWIPMQHAILHNAPPEVVKALIPTKDDCSEESSKRSDYHLCASKYPVNDQDYEEIIFKEDYHYRTPLHWAAYYDAPLETIVALKDACSKKTLLIKDHCNHEPYKTAIWHGRSTTIIETLFVNDKSLPYNDFEDVLVKLILSLIYNKPKLARDTDELLRNSRYEYESLDLHSISAKIAHSPALQKIIAMKSCDPFPTVVALADFYSCIFLILSYQISATKFLTGEDATLSKWFIVLVVSVSYKALREFLQIFAEHVRWFLSLWNYLDVTITILVFKSLFQMYYGENDDTIHEVGLFIVTTALVWLNVIFYLRSTFMPFATFVSGVFRIITDLIPFIVISFLVLMAFGEMFRLTSLKEDEKYNTREQPTYHSDGYTDRSLIRSDCFYHQTDHSYNQADQSDIRPDFWSFQDSLMITFGLFVEGIQLDKNPKSNPFIRIISMVFSFVSQIILLNVVVAIVNKAWDKVADCGKEVFWAYRLNFLIKVKGYEGILRMGGDEERIPGEGALDKILLKVDKQLSNLCKMFWPSELYWGSYESIFDRMFSHDTGSLVWQCIYGCRDKRYKIVIMTVRVTFLLIIFGFFATVWFIIGLFSFGLLWPHPFKRFFLVSAMKKDSSSNNKGDNCEVPKSSTTATNTELITRRFTNPNGKFSVNPVATSFENSNERNVTPANISSRENLRSRYYEELLSQIPENDNNNISSAALRERRNAPSAAVTNDNSYFSIFSSPYIGMPPSIHNRKRRYISNIDDIGDDYSARNSTPKRSRFDIQSNEINTGDKRETAGSSITVSNIEASTRRYVNHHGESGADYSAPLESIESVIQWLQLLSSHIPEEGNSGVSSFAGMESNAASVAPSNDLSTSSSYYNGTTTAVNSRKRRISSSENGRNDDSTITNKSDEESNGDGDNKSVKKKKTSKQSSQYRRRSIRIKSSSK